MLRIYGNLSDKHDPHFICPQIISSGVYLKLSTSPASNSPAPKVELKAHVHQKKNKVANSFDLDPRAQSKKSKIGATMVGGHLGGQKNLIAEEAEGTKQFGGPTIYARSLSY